MNEWQLLFNSTLSNRYLQILRQHRMNLKGLIERRIRNLKSEKVKCKIFLILQIVFIILTFAGAGYVFLKDGKANAGYAVVPMLGALIFGILFRNSQKTENNSL